MSAKLAPLGQPASLEFRGWGYKHASRSYFSVQDFNLKIPAGQRVLLLGASGIGKSTLLQGAAGLLGAGGDAGKGEGVAVEDSDGGLRQGRILIDGLPADQGRGRVGLVLQDPDAQAVFQRVGDNVAFGPENMNLPRERIWSRVQNSMAAVGLEDLQLHRSVTHLSGGQMQRLALAGALAMEPGVLLLDEPTANLDPAGVGQVVGAVRQVLERRGSTLLLVEHRAEPWIDMIDRVVVLGLDGGEDARGFRRTLVVADGSPCQVFGRADLDFAGLGVWVPERYARPQDAVKPIHLAGEPSYPADQGAGPPLLSAKGLFIGRKGAAIAQGINLDFRAGQITALVGGNGAGKSTLAMTLAGLLEPVAGQVEASALLRGEDGPQSPDPGSWRSSDLASRISYVFQNPEHQFARGSVLEEVMLSPLRSGLDRGHAEKTAHALLKRFRLSQYAHANPYTLSGGEKRRLTVASALAAAPRVLILDEPTFGQDRATWASMAELIAALRSQGVSIIVVTHDRELVQALGARVIELRPRGDSAVWTTRNLDRFPGGGDAQEPFGGPSNASSAPGAEPGGVVVPVEAMGERIEDPRPASRSAAIASLNPSIRLIGAFLLALPLLFSLDWVSALTALVMEAVLLTAAGFTPWRIVRSTWPLFVGAPGSAIAVLLYGKSGGAQLWQWGLMRVTERSAQLAGATALRILAIGIPAIIVMLGVDATDLADSFSQVLRLPDRFVYGGLAGLRLFSVLQDDWAALTASRRSRGLGDENKVKAFLPQAFALLVLSIRRSTTLAEAMEARGFGGPGPRSHARVSRVHPRDWAFLAICLAIPAVSLALAWFCGSFAFFGG
ncbi:ATP binding protein of ABC transporter [Bifidobacterium actinocoloniiforme DSM 22766]|uniref:ATP binding protein of ABC transporter n=1 Tax=Bifidobacterium actinocoloniiforme DSM 22766 TaxID=1437605 RepID=A0A086Z131_9BIFI|nr:ATP-binding cassette domain-containing protein [Bifidobacterium actinocoloniiforme]AKV55406.1 ABC transporter ATP-binding protein [Bifidobacterium actinocoloniiforme DSM 22766]KFI40231.1 ATP binding protein of ABC transporter [Bifidobacterium actinocoloniiforme DSM 22766]